MNVVGIIAEFNPFHSGHAHLIHRAKEITGSEYAVAVMKWQLRTARRAGGFFQI